MCERLKDVNDWQPSASLELLQLRADIVRSIRSFFEKNKLLEVDTPILSAATVPDPFIESFQTRYTSSIQVLENNQFFLHTSPEFPMKRLLASGSGSIFQITKVFRQGESGKKHNPEFTLLEWYRDAWDHQQLMREVEQLLTLLISPYRSLGKTRYLTYQDAFMERLEINPHNASKEDLISCAKRLGLANVLDNNEHKDRFLDLLFSHIIEPELGWDKQENKPCLCFLYHYPSSQASLAKIAEHDGQLMAERFEVFIDTLEIGNGFHELNNADEQRQRFEQDNQQRKQAGLNTIPMDEHFLSAVDRLPNCAGVAIGIERLLMVISQAKHIHDVLSFPIDRA